MLGRTVRAAALLAGAACLALAGAPAAAQQEPAGEFMIDIEGWRGGAFGRDDTGEFSHCGISKSFDNGVTLVLQTNPEFLSNLAMINEDWELEPQSETGVRLSVDGGVQRTRGAVAAQPNALAIPLGNDPEFYQALRLGAVLTIETEFGAYRFPLDGTARSLNALRQCVEQVNELMASDPEALQGQPQGPPNAMPIEALASILNAAGLEDLAFMDPEAVPDNALDLRFVWRAGPEDAPVIGGLHQEPRGEEVQIDRFAEGYINTLRDFCPEGFSSEMGETELIENNYALKTAEAECVTEEGADFVSLFFALDDFNYSVFYHMTAADNRAAAEVATDGVMEVVRELAGEAADAAERGEGAGEEEPAEQEPPGEGEAAGEEPAADDQPEGGEAAADDAAPAPAEDAPAEDAPAEGAPAEEEQAGEDETEDETTETP
jgi:hypothetical protein